jgi:hypothetical protein
MGFYLANLARSTKKKTLPFHLGIVYNRKFACCTCLKTFLIYCFYIVIKDDRDGESSGGSVGAASSGIINENF